MKMSNVYNCLILTCLTMIEITTMPLNATASFLQRSTSSQQCCNGILGYPGPKEFMPCSDLVCCNDSETVALQQVNHALGFCFRCMPKEQFQDKCYSLGEEVATTNTTKTVYDLRACCSGLKFQVILHTNNVALVIKCGRR